MPRTKTMDMEKSHFSELLYDAIGDFMCGRMPYQNKDVRLQFNGTVVKLHIGNSHGEYDITASPKSVAFSWSGLKGQHGELVWYKWKDDDNHEDVIARFREAIQVFYIALDDSVSLGAEPVSYDIQMPFGPYQAGVEIPIPVKLQS